MTIDFDRIIDRTGTDAVKFELRKAKFGRGDVLPLWVADMDFAVPDCVTEALQRRAGHPIHGYTCHSDALAGSLIDWLQRRHGWRIDADWIIWSPGVVSSLNATVMALTDPGETVIVQPPVYAPFFSAVTVTGRRLALNPLVQVDGRYRFDLDGFERLAADGARLLLLCSPHNPVGRVWTREELAQLLAIAERYRIVVLSDEIHHDLIYPEARHTPTALLTDQPASVISAVAPSKTFNIPGLGLSALIVPDPAQRAALKNTYDLLHLSATNPFSLVAFEAAYRGGEAWLGDLLGYLTTTRDWARDFIATRLNGIDLVHPDGTYLLWLDCRGLGLDDHALRRLFVEKAGLGLNVGIGFGEGGSGFMRLNIGAPRVVIREALQRLEAALHG